MSTLKERIDRIIEDKEWLDERVSNIFQKYCKVYGIHPAYGVESWEIWGDELWITQDITCRGCYDVTGHKLPVKYLYDEHYEDLIEQDFEEHERKEAEEKKRKQELERQRNEEKDRLEYERLKDKFEGGKDNG